MFNILLCSLGLLIFVLCALLLFAFGDSKKVTILPEENSNVGIYTGKVPVFLEWDGQLLTLHPSREVVNFEKNVKDIDQWGATYSFMDDKLKGTKLEEAVHDVLNNSDSKYFILLLRPSGFDNFKEICGYIQKHHKLDIGFEPINQQWRVDISKLWRKPCIDGA